MKFRTAKIAVAGALLAAFGMAGPLAQAQEAMMEEGGELEEVIVTGSYIKGSPEDAELPIDVVTDADLRQLGTPSAVELVRNLGVTAANLGETNQFNSGSGQANEGVATINLRGLGAARTLVLVNGRRHVSTELEGVDIGAFPINALGRIELLKDGAAAIYGSDAIGGVANFITRQNFDGFEIGGSYQDIQGSDGDYNIHILWGNSGDNWNFMLAAETGGRGELRTTERDWALVSAAENPIGGWSATGSPGRDKWIHQIKPNESVQISYLPAGSTTRTTATVMTKMDPGEARIPDIFVPSLGLRHDLYGYSDAETCQLLGAWHATAFGAGGCGFQYTFFDNLTEKTKTNKLFGSFDMNFSDDHRLHAEVLWSETDLPEWKTSPSYPPQSFLGPDRIIPAHNDGFEDYMNWWANRDGYTPIDDLSGVNDTTKAHPYALNDLVQVMGALDLTSLPEGVSDVALVGGAQTAATLSDRIVGAIAFNRAMAVTGRFGTGEPEAASRYGQTSRIVIGVDGSLLDGRMDYDVSLSWSRRNHDIGGQDMYVERMALALNGLGGLDCDLPSVNEVKNAAGDVTGYELATPLDPDGKAAGAGAGDCLYYNPFHRAIERSYVTGAENPHYNADVANDVELLQWLIGEEHFWERTNELTVLQGVISGETSWELPGGTASYAAGMQVRQESYDSKYNDVTNIAVNPCPFANPLSVALGFVTLDQLSPNCTGKTGTKAFLASGTDFSDDRTIFSLFGEMALPILSNLDMQIAIRYEDYGGNVGASVDPKVAISYRPTDELSLRASVSTTFRGPPQSILNERVTALAYVGATQAFKAIDRRGNPDLGPEKALSANFGIVYQTDALYASLDWWSFAFEDSFQLEGHNDILAAYNARMCTMEAKRTEGSECALLATQIFGPDGTHDNLGVLERIEINWLNGSDINTSGIDFKVRYDFKDVLPGTLGLALDGTYVLEYTTDAQPSLSGVQLRASDDLIGKLNYGRSAAFIAKPQLKMNFTVSYETESQYASLVARHISAYDDTGIDAEDYPHLATIDSHLTLDAHYQFTGWESFTVGLSIINLADEDPPAARGDLNYDPFTHNAFGRMVKVNLTYRM